VPLVQIRRFGPHFLRPLGRGVGRAVLGSPFNIGVPGRGFAAARKLEATRPHLRAAATDEPLRLGRTSGKQPSSSDGDLSCLGV
jgi:hypothetical protein